MYSGVWWSIRKMGPSLVMKDASHQKPFIPFYANWFIRILRKYFVSITELGICLPLKLEIFPFWLLACATPASNNARRNQMWTKNVFSTNFPWKYRCKCVTGISYSCRRPYSIVSGCEYMRGLKVWRYVACEYRIYPIFVYLFFAFVFDHFIPISFGVLVLLVTSAIASCLCSSLMLQRMYSNWMDDGIFRFSIIKTVERNTEKEIDFLFRFAQ